jgi:hypothetical protein
MEALRASTAFSPIFQTIIAAMVAAIKPWGSSHPALRCSQPTLAGIGAHCRQQLLR